MQKTQIMKTFFSPLAERKEMWYDRKNEQEEKIGICQVAALASPFGRGAPVGGGEGPLSQLR